MMTDLRIRQISKFLQTTSRELKMDKLEDR